MNDLDQEKPLNSTDEISLKEVLLKIGDSWHYLVSKWLTLLMIFIIGGAIGLTYALLKKPTYTAELSFALQDEKGGGGLGGALGLASQFGLGIGTNAGDEFSGDNLLELMKSRSMVEKALLTPVTNNNQTETLAEFYINFNEIRKKWKGHPELENIHYPPGADRSKFTLKQDSILGVLHKALITENLSVDKPDKKLSIISLQVSSSNELFSKYFTEVLEKTVSDFYIDTKTKKAVKNVSVLQHQTDSVRNALNSAISGVASSIDAAPNANPSLQTLRVPSQRRQVDVQANSAILNELVKNLELAKMSLLQETPLIQTIDRPILPLEKKKVGMIKGALVGGIIAVFLSVIILFSRRILQNILK